MKRRKIISCLSGHDKYIEDVWKKRSRKQREKKERNVVTAREGVIGDDIG